MIRQEANPVGDKEDSFSDMMDREAMQAWGNVHLQNSLPGKDIMLLKCYI